VLSRSVRIACGEKYSPQIDALRAFSFSSRSFSHPTRIPYHSSKTPL